MDAPTAAEVKARFSEFAATADADIATAASTALRISAVDAEATLHLTAHLLAMRSGETGKPDGGSGEVAKERVGDRDLEYVTLARGPGRESFFSTSPYGRLFLILESRSPARLLPKVFG